jgi:hypothetical protein
MTGPAQGNSRNERAYCIFIFIVLLDEEPLAFDLYFEFLASPLSGPDNCEEIQAGATLSWMYSVAPILHYMPMWYCFRCQESNAKQRPVI